MLKVHITKGILLCCCVSFLSCSLLDHKDLPAYSSKETYKATLEVVVNGFGYEGVGVIPFANSYQFEIEPPGKIDRIMYRTCNGERVEDKPDLGWFKKSYKFDVKDRNTLEATTSCGGLTITVLEEKKRRNAFATLEFKSNQPDQQLWAQLFCNMNTISGKGVLICQSAAGLIQHISFKEPVYHGGTKQPGCDTIPHGEYVQAKFKIAPGICTYVFTAQSKAPNAKRMKLRLTTRGYTDVPPIKL